MTTLYRIGVGILGLMLLHCGGGGGGETPAASESAVPAVITAAPFYPDEMAGVDTQTIAVSAVLQAPAEESKSTLRDMTSPVQASVAAGQWQWAVGNLTSDEYTVQLTYQVGAVPVATAAFPVRVENGTGTLALTRDGFTDVGGGDLDNDGLSNLKEALIHTDPAKADTDGDGLGDGTETATDPLKADTDGDSVGDKQDAFPLDPKENKDSDADSVGDGKDNCVAQANATQADVDHDGKGDVCDAINDETYDGDGDGVIDKLDAFPLDPTETKDSDSDTVGDNKDNCPKNANTDQTNTDAALKKASVIITGQELVKDDGLGDACDVDPDGDGRNVVYVDGNAGDDNATGYFKSPVKTLTQGMLLANAREAAVWVATDDYDVSSIVWLKGAQLFGGYAPSFDTATRAASPTGKSPTKFFAKGKTTVLNLQNLSTDTRFDGIVVIADATAAASSSAVLIDNSVVALVNCSITGNSLSANDTAVRVQHNGFATVDGGTLTPAGSAAGADSTGLWADDATVTLSKSSVGAGAAPHATGIRADSSTLVVDGATITATTTIKTQQRATGIWLKSTAPKITNTTITASGVQVEGIYFEKNAAQPAGTVVQKTTVGVGGAPHPLLRDWNGVPYTAIANGDFKATFLDGATQVFADVVGAGNTGGNVEKP
jgi:hypothetical protein